ncbi:hypothetical protein [Bacteroides nordii]|uniref:hypothetical protein n=1 Tax=Bacteroides nordii TaxID=291645 RepID=UPI0024910AF4|nr:hypothetical protein [Bacteroides nordii]
MKYCKIITYREKSVFYRLTRKDEFNVDGNPTDGNIDPKSDWGNSLYFIPRRGAISYFIESYPDLKNVMRAIPDFGIKVIYCTHPCFKDGNYSSEMSILIEEIAALIGKNKGKRPFMSWLGECGYAFQCYHDAKNMELIIPKLFFMGDNKDKWNFTFEKV